MLIDELLDLALDLLLDLEAISINQHSVTPSNEEGGNTY